MSIMIEKKAKNVESAVKAALKELEASEDEVIIEVLDEGDEGGILGFGKRQAHVRVTLDSSDTEISEDYESEDESEFEFAGMDDTGSDVADDNEDDDEDEYGYSDSADLSESDKDYDLTFEESLVIDFIDSILEGIGVEGSFYSSIEDDTVYVNVKGKDVGAAIGRRGETLDAIQYLASIVLNRNTEDRMRLVVDIAGYRKRRQESLEALAVRIAKKVIKVGKSYEMEPMNPAERRIIHFTLQDFDGVTTFSEGKDPERSVIISPVKD